MKRIFFVRHAKTEPWDFGIDDFSRKLTKRGINDSGLIAKSLKDEGLLPEFIYTSSANRAIQTTQILADHLDIDATHVEKRDELYEYVSTQDIQDLIAKCDADLDTLMIVGHNPWVSNVASMLSKNFQSILPTTGTVCLEYKINKWTDVQPGKGKLIYFKTPKLFK